MKKISIILPCCNEEGNIAGLYKRLRAALPDRFLYEIIFVDDGSTDNSLSLINAIAQQDKDVHYISFTRNFGHQPALKAGMDHCTGDCAVTMDADLQHPPEVVRDLIDKWEKGFLIVSAQRNADEHFPLLKRLAYSGFYRLLRRLTDLQIQEGTADFRLTDRRVLDVLQQEMKEHPAFLRGSVSWTGFSRATIPYAAPARKSGVSKYPFSQLLSLGVSGITSFSVKPLRLSLYAGLILMTTSLLAGLYILLGQCAGADHSATMHGLIAVVVFLAGLQLLSVGIVGEYLAVALRELRQRPSYVIQSSSYSGNQRG